VILVEQAALGVVTYGLLMWLLDRDTVRLLTSRTRPRRRRPPPGCGSVQQ
jgi:hypothetical protein